MSGRISEAHHSAAVTRVLEIVPRAAAIREHVAEIIASPAFKGSRRGQEFLRHIIERSLAGQFDDLKERTLGIELFGRPPSYDTAEDAVVRVTAWDVRKRLSHFYTDRNANPEIRIDLPPGSYIPEFHRSNPESATQPEPEPLVAIEAPPLPAPKESWRKISYRFLLAAAAIALLWRLTSGIVSVIHAAKPIQPWSALLQREKSLQLVLSDPDIAAVQNILETDLSLSDYANHRFLPEEGVSPDLLRAFRGYRGANVASVDTMIALDIADLVRATPQHMKIHTARSMKLSDLKVEDNFILLGSPRSNPWSKLFEDQLDFVFEYDQMAKLEIIRNKHPQQDESATYMPTARGFGTGDAFGIVGFVGNPGQSGDALLLAGSTAEATEAAGRMATNLPLLASKLKKCGVNQQDGEHHFEILLRVKTMAGSPNMSDVVACHLLLGQEK